MTKSRKWLTGCLIIAVIALAIQLATTFIGHSKMNIPVLVSTGFIPVVLLIALISTKENEG